MTSAQASISSLGVKKLAIFGSVARGEQKEGSDVDILVEFSKGKKKYDNFINLCYLLEDTIGSRVELVTKESLSPSMLSTIEKDLRYVEIA
jgi:predicted nucleotidyltransferase